MCSSMHSRISILALALFLAAPLAWAAPPPPQRADTARAGDPAPPPQRPDTGRPEAPAPPPQRPDTGRPEAPAPQQKQDDEPLATFKSNVNIVNLYFNVKDKHVALIPNLTKDGFEVYEDGKPQTIKSFSAEANQPLTLGILIDTSPSQTMVLELEKEAGTQFLRDVLQAKDEAFVISFDLNVDLLHDFTNSIPELKRALYRAK